MTVMAEPPPEVLSAEALAREGYLERSAPEEPPRPDDEKIAEEMLVLRLLAGFHEDEKGRPIVSYLKRNSPEERKARRMLARQLRDGTLGGIASELLALAIDPDTPSKVPDMRPILEIEFKSKARRNKSTWARDKLVVHFIKQWLWTNAGTDRLPKEEAAKYAAEQYFGLGRSQVSEIWQRYKEQISEPAK